MGPLRALRPYARALVYPLVAVAVSEFWPTLPPVWRWLGLLGVVLVAGWGRGLGPALVSLGAGAALAVFLWLPPRFSFRVARPADRAALGVFVGLGVVFLLLDAWLPADRRRSP